MSKMTWEEAQSLFEEAGLTGREIAAVRYRFGLPRDPDGAYLIFEPTARHQLVSKAMYKLRKARERREAAR